MDENPIITEIEGYALATGLAHSTICERAVGNTRLYSRLKNGGDCTFRIAAKLRRYFEEHPPENKGAAE